MDLGVVFGLSGMAVGLVSLVYARTQALHVKRQADAAHRATAIEIQDTMLERLFAMRGQLLHSNLLKQYLETNPGLRELYHDPETLKSSIVLRNAIDALQDIYFLRKRGLVEDHHWRIWMTAFLPMVHIPIMRSIFENAVSREALEPEFGAFFSQILEGKPPTDPRPRKTG